MTNDLMSQFTGSAEEIEAAQDRYYRFVLERLMDGLEAGLGAGPGSTGPDAGPGSTG